jgi:copper chaperone
MSLQLHIPTIVCEGCVDTLTNALQRLDPDAVINVDLAAKTLTVNTSHSTEQIYAAIAATGHTLD